MGGRGVPTSTCEEVEQPAAAQANAARYVSRNRSVIAEPPCQAFDVPAALNPRAPAASAPSAERPVLDLQDLACLDIYQQRVIVIAHPFVPRRWNLEREQPVIADHVLRPPVGPREYLAVRPAVRGPARRTMIGTDAVDTRGLEVVLVGAAIDVLGPGIPAMRLVDALIAPGPGMRLAVGGRTCRRVAPLWAMLLLSCRDSRERDGCDCRAQGEFQATRHGFSPSWRVVASSRTSALGAASGSGDIIS